VEEVGLPELPDGDKPEFETVTFTLHSTQSEILQEALSLAKEQGEFGEINTNTNGNAIARVCEGYLRGES